MAACRSKSEASVPVAAQVAASMTIAAFRLRLSPCSRAPKFGVLPIAVQIKRSTDWTVPMKALPVAIPTPTSSGRLSGCSLVALAHRADRPGGVPRSERTQPRGHRLRATAAQAGEFLSAAEKGPSSERAGAAGTRQEIRDGDTVLYNEARGGDGKWLHKSYLAK